MGHDFYWIKSLRVLLWFADKKWDIWTPDQPTGQRSHNQQAVSQWNETDLSYTLLGLSVAVTALLVVLSCRVSTLSCCDKTNSMTKDLETSRLDRKQTSQVLVAYDRPVSFQVKSVCSMACCGVRLGDTWIQQASKCFQTGW